MGTLTDECTWCGKPTREVEGVLLHQDDVTPVGGMCPNPMRTDKPPKRRNAWKAAGLPPYKEKDPGVTSVLFTKRQMAVIEWATIECRRQRSGEVSVAWMLHAWECAVILTSQNDAQRQEPLWPNEAAILEIARLVEPQVNKNGYRQVSVRVGSDIKMDWKHVPRTMTNLIRAAGEITPKDWFHEYENIHPFRDGNGRTGSILYNWLMGTLETPLEPPEFWGPREEVVL